jgi:hypothetical protein
LIDGRRCDCGQQVRDCPFWREVQARAFPARAPAPSAVVELQRRYARTRPRQWMRLRHAARGHCPESLRTYLRTMESIYAGISEVTGANVIVDSSKGPADAYALTLLTNLDVRIIHLVRDPRAAAYSWLRSKPAHDHPNRTNMPQRGPLYSSTQWIIWNGALDTLVRPVAQGHYMWLRYEDFAAQPRETAARLCAFAGRPKAQLPFLDQRRCRMEPTHSPSGNPDRMQSGVVTIEPDDRWSDSMSAGQSLLASLPAAPLLRRFGYPWLPRRPHLEQPS